MTTLKTHSFHRSEVEINNFGFKYLSPTLIEGETDDLNYLSAASGSDGSLKLSTLYDSELKMQFSAPREKCHCLDMHQFLPYLVGSFSEGPEQGGYLRFFEIGDKACSLGRAKVSDTDVINHIKIMPSGSHILCSTLLGVVIIIFVERWEPLAI